MKWSQGKSYLALIAVQLIFGTLPLSGKLVMRHFSPDAFIFWRVAAATILFFITTALLYGRVTPQRRRDYGMLAVCGLLGIALNPLFFVRGLHLSSSINASLLQVLTPIFTLLLAILFGYERFRWSALAALLLAAGGVLSLFTMGGETTLVADWRLHIRGNLYLVANTLAFAFYLVWSRGTVTRNPALISVAWMFFFATLMLGANALLGGVDMWPGKPDAATWFWLLYVILLPTYLVYFLQLKALQKLPASIVGLFIYIQPLIATGLGHWLLREPLSSGFALAALLIFCGLLVSQWADLKAASRWPYLRRPKSPS